MKWVFPLLLLITGEFVADILAKEWSLQRKTILAVGAILSYTIANLFWLFALKNGSGLARGAVLFAVGSGVTAVALGLFLFKEPVNHIQIAGMVLGILAVGLISWGGG